MLEEVLPWLLIFREPELHHFTRSTILTPPDTSLWGLTSETNSIIPEKQIQGHAEKLHI
jgi:hypothetical protein